MGRELVSKANHPVLLTVMTFARNRKGRIRQEAEGSIRFSHSSHFSHFSEVQIASGEMSIVLALLKLTVTQE